MHFREFGNPRRIKRVYDVDELLSTVEQYNGKTPCYTSVYVFDSSMDKHDGKTNYDSAVINTIWFDFDDKKVEKCHTQVKRFIRQYCKPLGIIPRIYLTGGKGFQMNVDFFSPVDLPMHIKKEAIRDYLLYLKTKYKLSTMDEICINNSVSCLRRIKNTQYIDKTTGKPNGVWCTQLTVDEVMKLSIEEIYGMAMEPRKEEIESTRSKKAQRRFVEFVADQYDVKHSVSNSIDYILTEIEQKAGSSMMLSSIKAKHHIDIDYIKPMRECIIKLIERNIERNHSSHEENTIIACEMVVAGYSDTDIGFVFQSIYNEPPGDWGWYTNEGVAGRQVSLIRQKALNRYSKDKLIRSRICQSDCACGV
tara:strand:+ start:5804 stop:6892 length:1089 start_codon:yes stop_codon:yes gene_type:complete